MVLHEVEPMDSGFLSMLEFTVSAVADSPPGALTLHSCWALSCLAPVQALNLTDFFLSADARLLCGQGRRAARGRQRVGAVGLHQVRLQGRPDRLPPHAVPRPALP